ncbi:hypothetical protein AAG570_001462 [Ranatra chinensis]|uniref:Uncharacterized protein n=1 Tax=Ranatra chinensis TaxID=642074 RepID=A0ABD0YWY4_9HEMI
MASKRRNMFHKNKTQETTEKEILPDSKKADSDSQSHAFRTKVFKKPRPCNLCHQPILNQGSSCRGENEWTVTRNSNHDEDHISPVNVAINPQMGRWVGSVHEIKQRAQDAPSGYRFLYLDESRDWGALYSGAGRNVKEKVSDISLTMLEAFSVRLLELDAESP